ncbi:oligoribonuclease isoform X2 [Nymphaea colorata]|uniref:oligoribonuclease isoform X2 n=1 Tax=Nymphaea colorata TaxID=210225 RepID=UPI00129D64D1|nr:oligoribonuclease isoform X2 [Nymphaea colorata]
MWKEIPAAFEVKGNRLFRCLLDRVICTMKDLGNIFSVLSLDVGDDKDQTAVGAPTDARKQSGKKKPVNVQISEADEECPPAEGSSERFRSPLVWIDLEMTGLNIDVDRILEIACIITDGKLTHLAEGPDLIIHQSKECLDNMGEWCQNHHSASGLTEKVLASTVTEADAETQVIDFLKSHIGGSYQPMLAGNSIYVDFEFLKKYMPDLAAMFSHVLVDVSSVNALCFRWYPKEYRKAPRKQKKHRAMDDIKESIMELRYFKQNIFKGSKK